MLVDLVLRLIAAFVILYLLFWVGWFLIHRDALHYLTRSKDKKWQKTNDASSHFATKDAKQKKRRKLVFVRHGESTWNVVFNQSMLPHKLIPRLVRSAVQEIKFIVSGSSDSVFYDSPLSLKGIDQARSIRTYLGTVTTASETPAVLRGSRAKPSCVVVSSNLRRAISTAVIGFWDRLHEREEKLLILPCLQEITINPDAIAAAPAYETPPLSWIERELGEPDMTRAYRSKLDMSMHTGSKDVSSNGLRRMLEFNEWLFNANEAEVVVAVGHSLWFKSYFTEFLPRHVESEMKKKKLPNCGMVELVVESLSDFEGKPVYRIDPDSVAWLKSS